MDVPRWTPEISVGEAHLDAQHQGLFEMAARLEALIQEGPTDSGLHETLVFLRRYTIRHFLTEEALLTTADYADLRIHRAMHVRLTSGLLELEARAGELSLMDRAEGTRGLMYQILDHIREEDRAYVPALEASQSRLEVVSTPSHLPVTGFDSVDRDHLCFLGLLEGLHEAVQGGHGEQELPEFLDAVQSYARQHFRREEMLMELVDYPDCRAHTAAHEGLMQHLQVLRERRTAGEIGMAPEVLRFFRTWLNEHIGGHDLAMVPFLKGMERS